jgi:hypothetical protein
MKEKFIKQSASSGQRAIRHYLGEEYDQFLIQAAASLEQLSKACLAAIHPSLVIDRDFDSFLHVCAAGKHAKRPPWNIKTITATEALTRCAQLYPGLKDFDSRLKLLAEYRNSAIHLGEIVETERKEIFHAFLAAISLIADEMEILRQDFFGEFAELVTTHLDSSAEEVNRMVAEAIARAKTRYDQKYGTLDSEHREFIVMSLESSYVLKKYEDQLVQCPACGHNGMVSGPFGVEWDLDYEKDGSIAGCYPLVTLIPSHFICNLCGLILDDTAELNAAGLGEPIGIENVDPTDFYEEPDY